MIKIDYHRKFKKNYFKRIKNNKKLDFVFHKRVEQFVINPNCQELNNHRLIDSMKDSFSFSITGDIRVIYRWLDATTVIFMDIGSHNQVY